MNDPLAALLADGVIDEVHGRLKSGKEADLWLVRHGGDVVAAKVYKARHARSFRNNAGYKEGRQVRDTRTQRAMDRGSRFGQAAAEEAWKAKEADALHTLHAAGVRVPTPVMFYEGVLLMELVLDAHGHPAPRLVDAHVPREQAAALYADLRGQVIKMLACHLIHGDLSPYNVLLGANGPVVIDFPQVVGAAHNSQAESFFQRDLENLRRFFAGIDPALRSAELDAREIWRAYVRRELGPDFVPTGRIPEPRPARGKTPQRAPVDHRRGDENRPRSHREGDGNRPRAHHEGDGNRPRSHHGGATAHPRPDRPASRRPSPRAPQPPARLGPASRPQGQGRRASPPMPEVIRVVRPPLGAPPPHAPAPHHGPSAPHHGPSAGTAGDAGRAPRSHRRRRRRRSS